jgi:hypothetical protein
VAESDVRSQKVDERPLRDTEDPPRKSDWRTSNEREADRKGGQPSGNERGPEDKCGRRRINYGPYQALTVITENVDPSLVTQGWVGGKPCHVTVDTGAYVTVARPDIAAGWPERQPNQRFTLQTVSGQALPVLKEVFLTDPRATPTQNLGVRRQYHKRVHLGAGHAARNASKDLGCETLHLAEEELSL